MVEQATLESVEALRRRDLAMAKRLYAQDAAINRKRFELESDTLIAIATQQPMAHDLRGLAAVLEVITELERMGDYAKGIDRIMINTADHPDLRIPASLTPMAARTVDMLHRALEAFVHEDAELARRIPPEDDLVDNFYNAIQRELLDYMIADPANIDWANHVLWAAHNLERMADRVINICERTVFVATGSMSEMDVSDDERDHLSA